MAPPMVAWRMALGAPFWQASSSSIRYARPQTGRLENWSCSTKNEVRAFIVSEFTLNALRSVTCVARVAPRRIVVEGAPARG
eukprot:9027786-Pyramimonas_sp.AAC.1